MFCPKCHTDLKDDAEYCRRCGTKIDSNRKNNSWSSFSLGKTFKRINPKNTINNVEDTQKIETTEQIDISDHNETHMNQYNYSKNYSNVVQDTNKTHQEQYNYSNNYSNTIIKQVVSEEDYKKTYIKTNQNFFNQQFSIWAMIFGPFYCLYRKYWTPGIILLIVYMFSYYTTDNASLFLRVALNIVLAFKFNKAYLNDVEKKVQQIKNQNQDKTSTELIQECEKRGGTLKAKTIIAIVIIYYILLTSILAGNRIKEYTTKPVDTEYTIGEISFKLSDNAKVRNHYTNYKTFIDNKKASSCYIVASSQYSNSTSKEYLTRVTNNYAYNYNIGEITELTIDDINWVTTVITSRSDEKTYYVTKINDNVYEFSFSTAPTNDICKNDIDRLLSTIKTQ